MAQRFLSPHAAAYNHFNIKRHLVARRAMKKLRADAFAAQREVAAA
ncbi:hypothetical protein [uncultured Albimonas sp.]